MANDFYCDEVLSGRTPVVKLEESESVLAFRHTRPHWPVHVVVIPKQHVPSLLDCDDALLIDLLSAVKKVAADVLETNGECRVLTHLGDYQESKHLHWHVGAGEPVK